MIWFYSKEYTGKKISTSQQQEIESVTHPRSCNGRARNHMLILRFQHAEPDHRSSSAYTPNVEPDHGPVQEKSGSNRGSEPNFRITIKN